MAFEAGGRADKLGNRHEGRWVAKQLIRLLREEIKSVTIEAIGDDEQGVDLWVERNDGNRQAQQCKARNASKEFWTISDLASRGVLKKLKYQLDRDENCEFLFVSGVSNSIFRDICDSARNSNGNSEDFYKFQILTRGVESQKAYFEFCKAISLDNELSQDRQIAFSYLRRIRTTSFPDDYNCWLDLLTEARFILTGDPEVIVSCLMNYAENNDRLGNAIYADKLYKYFEEKEITLKNLSHDNRILPTIQKLQMEFSESILPRLIDHKPLFREETLKCIDKLEKNGLVILHGSAGSGKSGVLYELTNLLNAKGILYLPIRVDRRVPINTAEQYGKSMGFNDSPVFCLSVVAGKRPCVLIIDQLDAIRWTSVHSFNSLDVCKELIRQVISLRRDKTDFRVVISCRTFDMEHDPELRNWLSDDRSKGYMWSKIEINPLNVTTIRSNLGETYDQMQDKQKRLLSNPQNLYMWKELNSECRSFILSSVDLLRQFWSYKFSQMEQSGIAISVTKEILDILVNYMEPHGKISAPSRLLLGYSEKAITELKSNGIIQEQNQVVSFCHQSYLDYLIADKAVREIDAGKNILNWIGVKENQNLFRREQLRQALNMISNDSLEKFLETIKEILKSGSIRFHLKHLSLEVLGQLPIVNSELINFCIELQNNDFWRPHIIDTVYFGHEVFIIELIDRGVLNNWLDSNSPNIVDQALTLLRSVVEKIPDHIAEILRQYIDINDEWPKKILETIGWQIHKDSDKLFALRLYMARKGVISHFINWKDTCSTNPLRAIKLIETYLSTYTNEITPNRTERSRLEELYEDDIKALIEVAHMYPKDTWDMLVAHVERLTNLIENKYELRMLLDNHYKHRPSYQITNGIKKILSEAGKKLASDMPNDFRERIKPFKNSSSTIILEIITDAYSNISVEYADNAIIWLLSDRDRFQIGNPEYLLAKNIIERLSHHCSIEMFHKLEKTIFHYHDPDEKKDAKYYLEARRQGYFQHYWGKAQFILLGVLCPERRSKKAADLLKVLKRRYSGVSYHDILRPDGIVSGGSVGSKLDKNLRKISDNAWLKIINNKKLPVEHSCKYQQVDDDNVVESSIWQFSRSLETIAKYYPERFGELALRFEDDIHPDYIAAILRAIERAEVDPNTPEDIKSVWKPASIGLVIKLVNKFLYKKDREIAITFCRLIVSRENEKWPDNIIKELMELAMSHSDLEEGELNMYSSNWDKSMESASVEDLFNNTINCVRGVAAEAIGRLLWNNYDMLDKLTPAINSLIRDKHPVIRMASIFPLLPVINIDRNKAVDWFITASKDDLRIPASRFAISFINYTIKLHFSILNPLIKSMIYSENTYVIEQGADFVTAYFIFYGLFSDELETCLNGNPMQKKGVAATAAQFIAKRDYSGKCREILSRLINDENDEVRQKVSEIFRFDVLSLKENIPLVRQYIFSEAFSDNSLLLYKLKDYSGSLLDFSEIIIDVCEALCSVHLSKTKEGTSRFRYFGSEISELLLRLYEESRESNREVYYKCLDIWDTMFENRVGFTRSLTQSIDS